MAMTHTMVAGHVNAVTVAMKCATMVTVVVTVLAMVTAAVMVDVDSVFDSTAGGGQCHSLSSHVDMHVLMSQSMRMGIAIGQHSAAGGRSGAQA